MDEKGVTVGYKEIYDELRSVSKSLLKLDNRMENIEKNFTELKEADKRSREADQKAESAHKKADRIENELVAFKKYQAQKEQTDKKYRMAIIGTLLPVILFLLPILAAYYN